MLTAITRGISPALARCELTHLERRPIDVALAERQHHAYEECLRELGCRVLALPAAPDLPDCVFIEDTALVFDELAILTRPGAESRRAETNAVEQALAPLRPLVRIAAPATLDGGDVLTVGKQVFVGLSQRTNEDGVRQLSALLAPHGYTLRALPVTGCLHLKSAVTQVGPRLLLINPQWVEAGAFAGFGLVATHPAEPHAANALLVGDTAVYPAACPRTRGRLEEHGVRVQTVDVSELTKAEGGVTCCSLILKTP
jgi:dimethylargininase